MNAQPHIICARSGPTPQSGDRPAPEHLELGKRRAYLYVDPATGTPTLHKDGEDTALPGTFDDALAILRAAEHDGTQRVHFEQRALRAEREAERALDNLEDEKRWRLAETSRADQAEGMTEDADKALAAASRRLTPQIGRARQATLAVRAVLGQLNTVHTPDSVIEQLVAIANDLEAHTKALEGVAEELAR